MPLPPGPRMFICRACGWKKTTTPLSDVVFPGLDWFTQCPACGATDLEVRRPGVVAALASRLMQRLGRR